MKGLFGHAYQSIARTHLLSGNVVATMIVPEAMVMVFTTALAESLRPAKVLQSGQGYAAAWQLNIVSQCCRNQRIETVTIKPGTGFGSSHDFGIGHNT